MIESYSDQAISGASLLRPGIQILLADAQSKRFNVILTESLDRISRDLEDIAGVYKRMTSAGAKMVTLFVGDVSELDIGLKSTMGALYLKDLADKTRRVLRGRVKDGKSGGGNSYGYDVVKKTDGNGEPVRGERRINEAEAQVVRRVFRDYAAGKSPKRIAHELNTEGVPGPAGNAWSPSTIYGNWRRGSGILNNELYLGRLVWNRLRYIKNLDTGKRVSRLNPESAWIVQEVPDLRIVDDALWEWVKAKQQAVREARKPLQEGNALGARKRPPYLFPVLIKCGTCGGGCSMISATHYDCSTARNKGTCDNRLAIKRDEFEDRVLRAMRGHLMEPVLFEEFCEAYTRAVNEWRIGQRAELASKEAELKKVERQIRKIIDAIKDGLYHASMKDEMTALEDRKVALERELEVADEPPPLLHPNMERSTAGRSTRSTRRCRATKAVRRRRTRCAPRTTGSSWSLATASSAS
ncbi:recombinase family protein [Azotobacter armeniacus]